jgi:hypothetical protein
LPFSQLRESALGHSLGLGESRGDSHADGPKGSTTQGVTIMSKLIHLAAAAVSFTLISPAFSADDAMMSDSMSDSMMECTDASMSKMKTDIMGMADGGKKNMAMKEIEMADDMMMKKDMKGCADHMGKAIDAMH